MLKVKRRFPQAHKDQQNQWP
uniref:Uncharacterized protein n=1 Tax=Rhizophora mucronata TaxID=61149 RepID=A0A2P2LMK6_RHIMU